MNHKKSLFESSFSDNFKPSLLEKLVIKFEKNRSDVISELIGEASGTLLDLACGDGNLLFKNSYKFKNLIGIDISEKRIRNAKSKLRDIKRNTKLFSHDLDTSIPLESSSVDVAVCEASIGCLVRPESFLKEVHRILKKDGIFIVQIGNYAFISRRIALLFGTLPKISSFKGFGDGGMLHYFTFNSLKELLIDNHFKILKMSNSGILSRIRMLLPSILSSDIIYKVARK